MSDQDTASKRQGRLKALRANMAAGEDGTEQASEEAPAGAGWRGAGPAAGGARRHSGQAAGGARRSGGGDFRERILSSLKDVAEGDELIEGTEVGRDNLEKLLDRLDGADASGPGKKLGEVVWGLLDPVETDSGLEFSPEGVAKLVSFLEEGPGTRRGQRPGAGGGQANRPRGRGLFRGRRPNG